MRTNTIVRLIFITLVLTLISACVVGSTMAQFGTVGYGNSVAYVSEWDVTVSVQGQQVTDESGVVYEETMLYDNAASISTEVNYIEPGASGYYTIGWTGTPTVDVLVGAVGCAYFGEISYIFYSDTVWNLNSTIDSTRYSCYNGSWYDIYGEGYYPIKWGLFRIDDVADVDEFASSYDYADSLVGLYNSSLITNYAEDTTTVYEVQSDLYSLHATLDALQFIYEAGTDISAKYMITWEWPLAADDTLASLNDTFVSNMTFYCSPYTEDPYYIVLIPSSDGTYTSGQILNTEEVTAYRQSGIGYTDGATDQIIQPYFEAGLTVWVVQYDESVKMPSTWEELDAFFDSI